MKTHSYLYVCAAIAAALLLSIPANAAAKDEWKTPTAEELAMKDNPALPGSHAMILDWIVYSNDAESWEKSYFRLKIFTEEGKKHANVEIQYLKDVFNVTDIQARTVRADGTVLPFTGRVLEKTVAKARNVKFLAKTFAIPDVQPGSIVEYRYTRRWGSSALYSTRWSLQRELFVKHARLALKPYTGGLFGFYWMGIGLPKGAGLAKDKDGSQFIELENLPPFQEERFAPPEDELKPRIELFYTRRDIEAPDKFWKRIGEEEFEYVERFMKKRGALRTELATLISPTDPPETKLRKIYARAQKIRNLSFERDRTDEEWKKENIKDNESVEDVLKRGYGWRNQINQLFAAMAQEAGFDAAMVSVSKRDEVFFNRNLQDARQLNGYVVAAKVDGKDVYLDPGKKHCPYGLLSWERTGVAGIRLAKDGGTFVSTPEPKAAEALTVRKAAVRLEEDTLKGTLQVAYSGQEALERRIDFDDKDAEERKKEIEKEIKEWLPTGAIVKLQKLEGLEGAEEPLRVEASLEVPNFGSVTGQRLIVPTGIFYNETKPFRVEKRVYPVYFRYPHEQHDDIDLEVPTGYRVETLPRQRREEPGFARYGVRWAQEGNKVVMQRRMAMDAMMITQDYYDMVREFYRAVDTSDQESAVLRVAKTQ